jgi:hypothetical protein
MFGTDCECDVMPCCGNPECLEHAGDCPTRTEEVK